MKTRFICFILIVSVVFISSCAPGNGDQQEVKPEGDDEPQEKAVTVEAQAEAGPIYTYNDNKGLEDPEIYMILGAEPVSVGAVGYIKYKGAITGERPMAVVEVAGKGIAVGLGDAIGDYSVSEIKEGYLRLERGMKCVQN